MKEILLRPIWEPSNFLLLLPQIICEGLKDVCSKKFSNGLPEPRQAGIYIASHQARAGRIYLTSQAVKMGQFDWPNRGE